MCDVVGESVSSENPLHWSVLGPTLLAEIDQMAENEKTVIPARRCSARVVVVATTLACLAPFVHKAFHIDDPLFIWSAKQIQAVFLL